MGKRFFWCQFCNKDFDEWRDTGEHPDCPQCAVPLFLKKERPLKRRKNQMEFAQGSFGE